MDKTRKYEFEGLIVYVPLIYDEKSQTYIEDYTQFIENSVFTPCGSPILFAGEDACDLAEEETPGGCPDCGSCRHYLRAGEHSWIGICKHNERQQFIKSFETATQG